MATSATSGDSGDSSQVLPLAYSLQQQVPEVSGLQSAHTAVQPHEDE